MIRKPCVSGLFYEADTQLLENNLKNIFNSTKQVISKESNKKRETYAAIVPHAGYVYSGKTASYAFAKIAEDTLPDTIIIVGPNHTGYGDSISLTTNEVWKTPLGNIEIDTEFNNELEKIDSNVTFSQIAHIKEHSIEVELPFLQYISKIKEDTFKLVPIVITQQEKDICIQLAKSIYEVSKKLNRDCIIIASTDLTHYEPSQIAKNKDERILKSIEDMDIESLINNINKYQISMCGYGPTITAISYSKLVNANTPLILNYSNSGDAFGDYESVVGYTSAIIKK